MRILQIDKFLDSGLPEAGGVGRQVAVLTAGLQRAGHQVLRFGCVVGRPPGEMPEFVDYTALPGLAARVRGAVRIVHNSSAARKLKHSCRPIQPTWPTCTTSTTTSPPRCWECSGDGGSRR